MRNNIIELEQKEVASVTGGLIQLTDEHRIFLDATTMLVTLAAGGIISARYPRGALLINFVAGMVGLWGIPKISRYFAEKERQEAQC